MKKTGNIQVSENTSRAAANTIRTKPVVNQPGDRYEQEADRIADRIVSMPETGVSQTRGNEHAMTDETTGFMEAQFGNDFSDVRLHTDQAAVQMNRELGANAFTSGKDIYFNEGKYNEDSKEGKHLLSHELTHVVQQGNSEPVIQRDENDVGLRWPTLETWAIQSPDFLGMRSFPLTGSQISVARSVFGNSLDLTQVNIVEAMIINSPSTFGNTIRIAPGEAISDRVLIHELTHVWQFQTQGASYISESINCQVSAIITEGDRGAAYEYEIIPDQRFGEYNPEQQATIVENYFAYPYLQSDPEYQRLIDEVRSASPSATPTSDALEDIPQFEPFGQDLLSPGGSDSFFNEGGNIPQLEFRFPGL